MKTLLLVLVMGVFLIVSIWFAWQGFSRIDIEIGTHGWIALGLGVFFSFVVGGGLMALVFISSRRGYDDIDHEL